MNTDKEHPTTSNKRKLMSQPDIDENPMKKIKSNKNYIMKESTELKVEKLLDIPRKSQANEEVHEGKLSYKLKSKAPIHQIVEVEGKMECSICTDVIKNIQKHFQNKSYCEIRLT